MKSGNKIHNTVYFIGLCLLAASMPLSKVGMSIAQMLLVLNWLFEWRMAKRFHEFFRNRTALILCSLYILHCIGLIYTSDFDYGLKDLRTKLPMLLLPLIIATSEPLDYKKFRTLIVVMSLGLFASSLHAFYLYITDNYKNIRDICIFISHLRISMLICVSIFFLLRSIYFDKDLGKKLKVALAALVLWFFYFLFILESFTGPLLIIICASALIIIHIRRIKNAFLRISLVALIVIIPLCIAFYVFHMYQKYFTYTAKSYPVHITPSVKYFVFRGDTLELFTSGGHPYIQDTVSKDLENGFPVWRYFCNEEMHKEWNLRSGIDYNGIGQQRDSIKFTLIRFLTSKGERKDSAAVAHLRDEEVKAIEQGIANADLMHMHSLQTRIYETLWEFKNYGETSDPNGHSIIMRLEYWRASWGIISRHPWIGVGTGDVNISFEKQYEDMRTKLVKRWQLKAHNQFLSFGVAFGITGMLWFIFVLFYPMFIRKYRCDFYYMIFFIILFCSLLTEDTLESQAGLTIYALLNTVLLLGRKEITEKSG